MNQLNQPSTQLIGTGFLLTATLFYGFFGVLSRLIGFELPLYFQTGVRALLVASVLVVFILLRKEWKPVGKTDLFWIAIRGIFGMLALLAFFVSVNFLPIGTVYFIFYAGSTVGGYIIGRVLFAEKLTAIKIWSLVLSIFGLYLIYSVAIDPTQIVYALLALFSGFSGSIWNTLPKKISHGYSATTLTFLDNAIGAAITLVVSLLIREQWVTLAFTSVWLFNGILGALFIVTGWLVVNGFRRLDAQIGSLVMLAEVLFATLLGFLFYQETIAPLTVVGGLVILFAIILPERKALLTLIKRKTSQAK